MPNLAAIGPASAHPASTSSPHNPAEWMALKLVAIVKIGRLQAYLPMYCRSAFYILFYFFYFPDIVPAFAQPCWLLRIGTCPPALDLLTMNPVYTYVRYCTVQTTTNSILSSADEFFLTIQDA